MPDGSDDKWEYPEHTAAKHEILRRYLGAWLTILGRGKQHARLILIDGFAGRGRYMQGQPGSPAIMFERAAEVAEAGLVREVLVRCSEPDEINFGHLTDVANGLVHPRVKVVATQERFEDVAQKFIEFSETQTLAPPTFIMVDPYGIKGVRLETLRRLLSFHRVEVFLTFMVRDPARHIEGNYEPALTALFGGDAWRKCIDDPNRTECLMRTFQDEVTRDVATYVLPYKVHADESRTVLYYLVHLTNSDLGMRVMKEKMVKKSGEMTFFPITLRPTDQLGFDVQESSPFPSLQRYLLVTYAGRSMTFLDLLNEDYPLGHKWLNSDYSKALQAMEKSVPPSVAVSRVNPLTETGRRTRAIAEPDTIVFSADVPLL